MNSKIPWVGGGFVQFPNFSYVTYCQIACCYRHLPGLLKMVSDCLRLGVNVFEVVASGF